jgi:GT2 family glycosyltransferase
MAAPADIAIIVVSTNEAKWLESCLGTVFEHAGGAQLDVVVVDNSSADGTSDLVRERFPQARVVMSENHGFAHANNRGAETCDARYLLFLNPDTEIVDGTFADLVRLLDARPDVGLAGVRQITADGALWPTIRRFPSARRALGDALASERWPRRFAWAGERETDLARYEAPVPCDWTSGSFMLARRDALLAAGLLDERFFIYCEEPDLCLRIKRAGWEVWHVPTMTIIHHAGKGGIRPRMLAQDAYARRQYAAKHFSAPHRAAYIGAVATRHAIRAIAPGDARAGSRQAARVALRTLAGLDEAPFGPPPGTAIARSRPMMVRRDGGHPSG